MALERWANNAQDTLASGIDDNDLSLTLNDASEFPTDGDFRIRIDDELIRVTAVAGNVFTIVRGIESTVAASHSSGATATQVLTRDGLIAVGTNLHRIDTYANRPAAGVEGRLFLPTNGYHLQRDTGSVWESWGPLMPLEPVIDGDFAWLNQGGATLDVTRGGAFLLAPAVSGDNVRARIKTLPSAPYTITIAVINRFVFENFLQGGLLLRESGTGELTTLAVVSNTLVSTVHQCVVADKWNSATSFNSGYTTSPNPFFVTPFLTGPCIWLQIEDNATTRFYRISADGINFTTLFSVGNTDFLTPDQAGFYAATNNTTHLAGINVLSWKEE